MYYCIDTTCLQTCSSNAKFIDVLMCFATKIAEKWNILLKSYITLCKDASKRRLTLTLYFNSIEFCNNYYFCATGMALRIAVLVGQSV